MERQKSKRRKKEQKEQKSKLHVQKTCAPPPIRSHIMELDTAPNTKQQQQQHPLTLLSSTAPHRPHSPEEEPGTPSSTIAEFGDAIDPTGSPAYELVGNVYLSSSRSRLDRLLESLIATLLHEGWDRGLMERLRGELRGVADQSMSMMSIILPVDDASAPLPHEGVTPKAGKLLPSGRGGAAEPTGERQLYRRIVAFLLSDSGIVAEMRELERELVSASQERRVCYEAAAAAAATAKRKKWEEQEGWSAGLSDKNIVAWFADQEGKWHDWAQAYGPNRGHLGPLVDGLSAVEQDELRQRLGDLLQLTDAGGLPLAVLGSSGEEMPRALLQGMLADFLCAETIASPEWVFAAAAASAAAHRVAEGEGEGEGEEAEEGPFFSSPLPVSSCSSSYSYSSSSFFFSHWHVAGQSGASAQRNAERPFETGAATAQALIRHRLRAQIMQTFTGSGMHLRDAPNGDELARGLVACRQSYARELAAVFLSGPARFLLPLPRHHQKKKEEGNATVAEHRCEQHLVAMVDEALRFSCRLWSRPNAVRLVRLGDLGGTQFEAGDPLISLWQPSARTESPHGNGSGGLQRVAMVVQPAVVDVAVGGDGHGGSPALGEHGQPSPVWLKAQVVAMPVASGYAALTPAVKKETKKE